jgi:Uma2 family endonuclease
MMAPLGVPRAMLFRVLPRRVLAEHIMTMPARSTRVHRWTTADVRALMDASRAWPRFELIGGELLVTPAPEWVHQTTVFEVAKILDEYCERERVGVVLMSPADLELIPGEITQPDVFVIPYAVLPEGDARPVWSMIRSLRLAVEIISPSSARTDRVDKRDHYLSADVEEYWVIDVETRLIERWLRDRERPTPERDRLVWHPVPARTALEIHLPQFFTSVLSKLRRPK